MENKKNVDQATWIWYPGDFEIWLGNKFNNRRTERGAMFPPFWKQDSHYVTVEFSTMVTLQQHETISIAAEGDFNLMVDGKLQFGMPARFTLSPGEHSLNIKVHNQHTPPALFVKGKTIKTNKSWLATYEDKIWIDENGEAHGSGVYVPAASWNFNKMTTPPSAFQLQRTRLQAIDFKIVSRKACVYDFGLETFGYPLLVSLRGKGRISLYYGESLEEATDKEHCETLDHINVDNVEPLDYMVKGSKAFRFVLVEIKGDVEYDTLDYYYEYSGFNKNRSGNFRCNDKLLNRIWDIAAYTMDLTTREFFVDGIKRDRWTWSGDAIQSYLMNYYLRFDSDCVRRTIRQLRGKEPVTAHVNTIMDYTFYWFKSVYDFYQYTGDIDFVREIYPRMQTLMQYVLQRTNAEGMAEGKPDDWIFVDWVDFPMHKRGTLCFEQILFCKALQTMALCADTLAHNPVENPPQGSITVGLYLEDAAKYNALADALHKKLKPTFWDAKAQAFMHAIEDGQMNRDITMFPNMFAVIYDMVSEEDKRTIMTSVLHNPNVQPITTPYMRFYELEALGELGEQERMLKEILSYWGGMCLLGATSFWEKYVPSDSGAEHLAMYGRPYGKSLCHAWGASPVYLLGKYFLGIKPTKPGYTEYEVKPVLGGLQWMKGSVPTPFGLIKVTMNSKTITVKSDGGKGTLVVGNKSYDIPAGKEIEIDY